MTVYKISLSDEQADKLADYLSGDVAEQIRAQIPKPVVNEPMEFGSVIWATNPDGEHKRWVLGADDLGHPWISELDSEFRHYEELTAVEVLRVGIGESAPVDADEFMVSAGFSPYLQQVRDLLFRSPSGSMTNEEAAAAYKELRKSLSGLLERQDVAPESTEDYKAGVEDYRAKMADVLRQKRSEAITAERQNAYDVMIGINSRLIP